MPKSRRRLTKRDRLILTHLALYGLGTTESLHQLFFAGKKLDAVKSTLRRLGSAGAKLLVKEVINGSRRVYYRLTPKGATAIGHRGDCKRLGDSRLPRSYALMYFTCLHADGAHRHYCHPRQHPDLFPLGGERLPKIDFYMAERTVNETGKRTVSLGFTITDTSVNWRRIVERSVKHTRRLVSKRWFEPIMRSGNFELTVLTVSPPRRRAIELVLDGELRRLLRPDFMRLKIEQAPRFPIQTQVVCVPGLDDLIPTPKNQTR